MSVALCRIYTSVAIFALSVSVAIHSVPPSEVISCLCLTEVFPCFFLGCKANARVILAKTGHCPHSSKIVVLFYVLFVLYRFMYYLCVNVYYCHRVTTQLQLTNISYPTISMAVATFCVPMSVSKYED